MKRAISVLCLLLIGTPAGAQWLNYPTPGLPRTKDGKPDLAAPAPRAVDGHPDISGLWRMQGFGYGFNVLGANGPAMLPWADALYKQRLDGFAKDDTDIRCLPPGPRAGLFAMEPFKIVQTPGLTIVMHENAPPRQIFTDGRPLPRDPNPSWMGYSIGRWEGDTLVVTTSGFNDRTWLDYTGHPHSEALTVTERFSRTDFGEMQLEMTFEDPKTYTRPWTISVPVHFVPDTEMLEFVCNENERDRHHMVGSLQEEKNAEAHVAPHILRKYAGTYRMMPFGDFTVTSNGHQLLMELPGGGGTHALITQSETTFLFPSMGAYIEFVPDAGGAVNQMVVKIVEGDLPLKRVR